MLYQSTFLDSLFDWKSDKADYHIYLYMCHLLALLTIKPVNFTQVISDGSPVYTNTDSQSSCFMKTGITDASREDRRQQQHVLWHHSDSPVHVSQHACGSEAGPLSCVVVTPWPQTGWSDGCRLSRAVPVNHNTSMTTCLNLPSTNHVYLVELHLNYTWSSTSCTCSLVIYSLKSPPRFCVLEKILGKILLLKTKIQYNLQKRKRKIAATSPLSPLYKNYVEYPLYKCYHLALVTSVRVCAIVLRGTLDLPVDCIGSVGRSHII